MFLGWKKRYSAVGFMEEIVANDIDIDFIENRRVLTELYDD